MHATTDRPAQDLISVPRDEWERYQWMLGQVKSAPTAVQGVSIFDLNLMLPPAPSFAASVDLARSPFIAGDARVPCLGSSPRRARFSYDCVACDPVVVPGKEMFRLGVHCDSESRFHWSVTDFLTGYSVGKGSSREAAIEKAMRYLKRGDADDYLRAVTDGRKSIAAEGDRQSKLGAIRLETKRRSRERKRGKTYKGG